MPARIFKAAKDTVGDVQDAASSASGAAKDKVADASSKVSEAVLGSETPATESATSRM